MFSVSTHWLFPPVTSKPQLWLRCWELSRFQSLMSLLVYTWTTTTTLRVLWFSSFVAFVAIEKSPTTMYHSAGNGLCEQFNQTHHLLCSLPASQKRNLSSCLPQVLYNTTPHKASLVRSQGKGAKFYSHSKTIKCILLMVLTAFLFSGLLDDPTLSVTMNKQDILVILWGFFNVTNKKPGWKNHNSLNSLAAPHAGHRPAHTWLWDGIPFFNQDLSKVSQWLG